MIYINKAEVMLELEQGAVLVSHDRYQWLERANGQPSRGFIRHNLWNKLWPKLEKIAEEKRPPSRLRYYIYKLRKTL